MAGSQLVWEMKGETGTVTTEQLGGTLLSTTSRSSQFFGFAGRHNFLE